MEDNRLEELCGSVERVVFRNADNGWTVLELEAGEELHKVVGVLPAVAAGEQLRLKGKWVEHPSFGRQFRAEQAEQHLPAGSDAILRYLSSGAVKGIGVATAARIVEKFGDETLRILEEEPGRLAEIKGITAAKAKAIGEAFAGQFGLREVMLAFADYGLTPSEALRCYKRWGSAAVDKIRRNPYLLCSSGLYIGFDRADRICMGMDRPADDPARIEAGLLYVLRHNLGNGHTCLPADRLIPTAAGLLGVDGEKVRDKLSDMALTFAVRTEEIDGRLFVFLPHLYQAEKYAAARLRLLTSFAPVPSHRIRDSIEAVEKNNHITYETRQRQAIIEAVEKGMLVLTGGPGTGKTTTLRAIITLLESMGETVAIAAPTGRAAKRIAELTGCEAKTIHRLLEVQWDDADTPVFVRNEKNPLDADALVVDEVSMVDVLLFESLLRAMKTGSRLILVGDTDQLPAVGPGSVLHDIIDSGVLPVVQLTEVFRQAMESAIVANAHRIVAGEIPDHLRIRFHHSEGRAQVVGYVGDEVTLHLVGFGKLLRRVVQRLRKIVHLRIAAALERCLIVAVRQTFGGGGDVDDGGGNVICREEREQEAEEYQQYRDNHGLPFQDGNGGLHRHQRRIQQQIAGDCLVLPVDGAAVDQHLAL